MEPVGWALLWAASSAVLCSKAGAKLTRRHFQRSPASKKWEPNLKSELNNSTDALLPAEMAEKAEHVGVDKTRLATMSLLALAMLAGAFVVAQRTTISHIKATPFSHNASILHALKSPTCPSPAK